MQERMMNITRKQKMGLLLSGVVILVIYAALTLYFGNYLSHVREEAAADQRKTMSAAQTDVQYPPKKAGFYEVKVGSYLENIQNVSIADSTFSADFYIWFTWKGDKDLDPGDKFQIVGGRVDSKELSSERYLDDGTNYQRYKVSATIDKVYDSRRISLEDHMLNIYIEDKKNDGAVMNYIPDNTSAISSRVSIPGYRVTKFEQTVKPHVYKSTFSSPGADGANRVFSQYVIGISIDRSDWGFYFKIYLPFLLSVALGLIVLWTKPELIDTRTGLGGASFFGVVANAYIVNSLVPPNGGEFGLLDVLTITSLISVFIIVAAAIASMNLSDKQDQPHLAVALDRVTFFSITLGYILISVVLPLCTYA